MPSVFRLLPLVVLALAGFARAGEIKRADTTVPVTQAREVYGKVTWLQRHEAILARNAAVKPDFVFLGDSITHFWSGEPVSHRPTDAASWATVTLGRPATNMGYGFDYIENAAWRVDHGELDGIAPKVIVVLLGTNNLGHKHDTPAECERGMKALLAKVRAKCPASKIILLGILPRGEDCAKAIAETNALYAKLAGGEIVWSQAGNVLGNTGAEAGTLVCKKELFRDGLHPNATGYAKLAEALAPVIAELAGPAK